MERRVISVLVQNEHGVLSRISGLFAGRGYNIETLTVAPIPNSDFSRLTIVTSGSPRVIEQIIKQLHKLIPVYKVIEHEELIEKEMVLAKIPLGERLADVEALCKAYNGSIVNVGKDGIIVMAADEPGRVKNFIHALGNFNPKEIIRGGVVAIER
ncbi:acetolactate synthase small subunit [Nitrosophilus labii]|uniref:acetolactate synthase small subunit n=1 Tax=Nitrosophilus labii TaxID=2706014 RepID=UPI001657163C|nr:acetolactate synthase small subunit [Nitrosophilus labii]